MTEARETAKPLPQLDSGILIPREHRFGRRLVAWSGGVIAGTSVAQLFVVLLVGEPRSIESSVAMVLRTVVTMLACYYATEGHAWARWLLVVGASVGVLQAGAAFVHALTEQSFLATALFAAYALALCFCVHVLGVSDTVAAFFAYVRQQTWSRA